MEKNCCAPQCFQGKSYKAKFSISLILKKLKSIKIILEKIIKKTTKGKKTIQGNKHCNNLQCFMRKSTVVILN